MTYDPPTPQHGVVIYGASDDLIEIDGEVRDEFSAWTDEHIAVNISDGTRAAIWLDTNGVWRIHVLTAGTGCPCINRHPSDAEDDQGRYTDVLHIAGPVTWVRAEPPANLTAEIQAAGGAA